MFVNICDGEFLHVLSSSNDLLRATAVHVIPEEFVRRDVVQTEDQVGSSSKTSNDTLGILWCSQEDCRLMRVGDGLAWL